MFIRNLSYFYLYYKSVQIQYWLNFVSRELFTFLVFCIIGVGLEEVGV